MQVMWHLVGSLVADGLVSSLFSGGSDCTIRLPRRSLPGPLSRILPAPDADGTALVWQENEVIRLQRFKSDCGTEGDAVEVNRSQDFWGVPDASGLADAASLAPGTTAVAWILGGDVWVRVVNAGTGLARREIASTAAIRANNVSTAFKNRAEVRVVANPSPTGGFIVAWSSWQQDGDGWGIFARFFNASGQLLGLERQLNSAWKGFQWRPQLVWCGPFIWALWANSTGIPCSGDNPPEDCANGPMLRRFSANPNAGDPPVEVDLGGKQPLEATVACADGTQAVSLWLQDGGKQVRWEYRQPVGEFQALPEDRSAAASRQLVVSTDDAAPGLGQQLTLPIQAKGAVTAASLPSQVAMLATSGLLVLLTSDVRGTLTAQLLDYAARRGPVAYPGRKLAFGAVHIRAAWDLAEANEPALVACFLTGDELDLEHATEYICLRRRVMWLASEDGLGMGGSLALAALLFLLLMFCCLRPGTRGPLLTRTGIMAARARRRSTTRGQQAQLRELRAQLAQIPMVPIPAPAPTPCISEAAANAVDETAPAGEASRDGRLRTGSSQQGADVASTLQRAANDSSACTICQNEVVMRVALQPCGHTACRDCVTRLVEINQRCHICRGTITGVQPVYL